MNQHNIVTQCPVCLTQFRVGHEQLSIANGQVRCGSCMHSFNASKNSLSPVDPSVSGHPLSSENLTEKPGERFTPTPDSYQKPIKNSVSESQYTLKEVENPNIGISAEPVTLQAPELISKRFPYGWFSLCILAIVCFGIQYSWFNRAELYWNYPDTHAVIDSVCTKIDCKIPSRHAINEIENQSILVTPHPKFEGAMQVNLILNNRAEFEQNFPAIHLKFTDLKGRLVADRTMQPREYLDVNQLTSLTMPIQQPQQITLEIMSPGTRAVNYQLSLLAPKP